MPRNRAFSLLAIVTFVLAAPPASANNQPPSLPAERIAFSSKELAQGYREHVILAKPRASHRATVDADEIREGVRVRGKFARFGGVRVIELDDADSAHRAIARLQATGRYEFVESDRLQAGSYKGNGGHRPPLQNSVWAQRDSTGSGCLSPRRLRSESRK